MKFNRKTRKKLLSKLAYDPGTSPITNVDVKDILNQPVTDSSTKADPALVNSIVNKAIEGAVEDFLTDVENHPEKYA